MAITRLGQAGFELRNLTIETSVTGDGAISSTKARTGTYSCRFEQLGNDSAGIPLTSASAQFRESVQINHNGVPHNSTGAIFRWKSGSTVVGQVDYYYDGTLRILVGSTVKATVSAASVGFTTVDKWFHVGVDVKLAASSGWIYVYLDGILILSYDGDTLGSTGKTTVDQVLFGGGAFTGWSNYAYFDDFVPDDTTGEAAPVTVPDQRLWLGTANGNGAKSQMTGSDGDQIDNYKQVDEVPHDGDTTYNKALTPGLTDLYDMTTISIPEDWAVAAVIGTNVVRKSAAGDDVKASVTLQSGAVESVGTAQALGTSYAQIWQRWTTDPNTGIAWKQAGIDAVQIGCTSAGTFA